MTKLCARGKSAAKRKFKVYPSAYANAYASKICAGKIKDPSGTKRKDWGPKKASEGAIMNMKKLKKGGGQDMGAKKKKMPEARDAAMMDKDIVYMGDPFMVDGEIFDPVKEDPELYLRPEGAENFSKGGEARGTGCAIKGKGFNGVF
jgi:hypothetical protein